MAGIVSEESGVGRSMEGILSGHHSQSGEALAEWRSSEQVENGTPSTSPPYWDTDEDDDGGPKPSELYGKYTWKIEKFSQLNKRELRSNAFEVGGYKWYILIYPQGCDVCNHLSLFLCVANHDKLLPGWSHFAQFTIAVVNKDPKKSKYSDTLHRFWKKEHDWGWKKFMELSKVLDGFIDSDTLIIKAQVQVIREKADRPFRCLDCQYRRELVRVYLTNVEQICRRFMEERRIKLGKLIEDKAKWSSFCAFWLGIDQNARRRMSREKTDVILRVVVKHFFVEKEVASTLVMDSLYSGLKALEGQNKCKKGRGKLLDAEEMPAPIVRVDKDMFVLVDDVLLLLERAAMEMMEPLPPKDEKGTPNRTKDGSSGEDFNKDSIERDERRLTELGRRTVEIFVLAHIFSNKIEVAYQEAVALKRQEELIREEEAAWQAESEQKARRGATEKEKKSKKKQAKQKRNNRRGKDRLREERADVTVQEKQEGENPSDEKKDSIVEEVQPVLEKPDILEDVSDVSDSVDGVAEILQPDLEDRDASDASEIHHPTEPSSSRISGLSSAQSDKKSPSAAAMDDSSSTCSTDSVPSIMNGPCKGNSVSNYKNQRSPCRGKIHRGNVTCDASTWVNEMDGRSSGAAVSTGDANDVSGSSKPRESESEAVVLSLEDRLKWLERHMVKKEDGVVSLQEKLSNKDQVDTERPFQEKRLPAPSSPQIPSINLPTTVKQKSDYQTNTIIDSVLDKKTMSKNTHQIEKAAPLITPSQKSVTTKPTEKAMQQQVPVMSRPSSAPLIPDRKPTAPVVSMVQTAPLLARSISAAGRLGPDPSPATHSYNPPQSYRNAIIGNHVPPTTANFTHRNSPSFGGNPSSPTFTPASASISTPLFMPHNSERLNPSTRNPSAAYSQASAPMFVPQNSERLDPNTVKSSFPFGMVSQDMLKNRFHWTEGSQREASRNFHGRPPLLNDIHQNLDLIKPLHYGTREQSQGMADEFPHLDIINDLLNDEHGIGKTVGTSSTYEDLGNGESLLDRQFSVHGDMGISSEVGTSNRSSRFERTRNYRDGGGFYRSYNTSSGQFEHVMDFIPQASSSPPHYVNGQIDGMIPNQWQMGSSDLSLLGTRGSEYDGYSPYFSPDYSNLACGINGYTIFRPSNGH